jgi:hypothetical protein
MSPIERDHRFNMLLSDEEQAMLRDVSEAVGMTASAYIRTLIRREHEKLSESRLPVARDVRKVIASYATKKTTKPKR